MPGRRVGRDDGSARNGRSRPRQVGELEQQAIEQWIPRMFSRRPVNSSTRVERMFEETSARLLAALQAAFGEAPRWELRPNKTFGLYLYYDPAGVSMAEVRDLIDRTLRHEVGVILAPRLPGAPMTTPRQ